MVHKKNVQLLPIRDLLFDWVCAEFFKIKMKDKIRIVLDQVESIFKLSMGEEDGNV